MLSRLDKSFLTRLGAVVKGVGCWVIKLAETECFSAYRDVLTCADKSTADTLRIICAELIALF